MSITQISVKALDEKIKHDSALVLLDVRESNEFEFAHIVGSLHIPLGHIAQRMGEISTQVDCVVICHHGMRSQQAAHFLVQSGFSRIFNLSGGIDAWSIECDNAVLRY